MKIWNKKIMENIKVNKKLKICNLYSGLGGNRKLWGNEHKITAIENVPEIAKIYQDFFPNDKVIIVDAHQYLLDHYKEFDFIFSSPPCPSHSCVRKITEHQNKPIYPDMKLYQEILLLKHYFKGKYCVENVISFYEPLIPPQKFAQHYFWTNFLITPFDTGKSREHKGTIETLQKRKGFNLCGIKNIDKRTILRNCVEPEVGLHILECVEGKNKQKPML